MENDQQFQRTARLLGQEAVDKLATRRVAVFGVGGVGSFAVEALARAGIGHLRLIDGDVVDITNLNRQLIALHSTLGMPKVEAAAARIRDINPSAQVEALALRYGPEGGTVCLEDCDYIIDAIDDVRAKLLLIENAVRLGVPVISSMGAGNKLNPTAFRVADIAQTSVDPLARVMRRELKKRGIGHIKVVFSTEPPQTPRNGLRTPASVSFVPSVAGLILAGEVIKDLIRP